MARKAARARRMRRGLAHWQLYTGVPNPAPTYGDLVHERHEGLGKLARPKEKILEMFVPE